MGQAQFCSLVIRKCVCKRPFIFLLLYRLQLIVFVVYLQAFAEHGVIQMALVAFYRQFLGTLCPSVFVTALYQLSG